MRKFMLAIVAVAVISGPAAFAQVAAAPKVGTMLVSADGKRLGRIERIVTDRDGQPMTASVIYDSHFVYVPLNTLSVGTDGRATTSLSRKDVASLR